MTVQGIPVYLPESVQQEIFEELLKLTLQAVEKAKKRNASKYKYPLFE